MNSSINPSFNLSNSSTSAQEGRSEAATAPEIPLDSAFSNRQQPIPPPSDPMQYRAIGLVRGRYNANAEQFTQGTLVATDGTELDAVLLGRIMSLVRNHLDLAQEHLWVVYPRTGQENGNLHLQIIGVWEPEKLNRLPAKPMPDSSSNPLSASSTHSDEATSPEKVADGYFSVRGEIVYQSAVDQQFVVKIKQAPRKEADKPKYFKLRLQGVLTTKAVGQFWDLHVQRQVESLVLLHGEVVAALPSKPKLRSSKPRQSGYSNNKRNSDIPRPVPKTGNSLPVTKPVPKSPSPPKPIKRQKPPQ